MKKLAEEFLSRNLDFLILPSTDPYLNEYVPDCYRYLEYFANFNGSAGTLLILKNNKDFEHHFFTDGRYTNQAKKQLDKNAKIYNIKDENIISFLLKNKDKLSAKKGVYFPELHNISWAENINDKLKAHKIKLVIENISKLDKLWSNKPQTPNSNIIEYPIEYAGVSYKDKIKLLLKEFFVKNIENYLISDPASICWLLNLRAKDVKYTPLLLAKLILKSDGEIILFTDESRFEKNFLIKIKADKNIKIIAEEDFENFIKKNIKNIFLDRDETNYKTYLDLYNICKSVSFDKNPCILLKAIKNNTELKNIRKAHELDGKALSKFISWFDLNVNKKKIKISEIEAAEKLAEFRFKNKECLDLSFTTISSFKENGAIIHYSVNKKTNKEISFKDNGLYLVDSGGQYLEGTTDVTRTLLVGKASKQQIKDYTLVLKGHIALAMAVFPVGTTGSQLDILARQYLWQNGLDFDHGTGHGVGCYLSVHEGPHRISKVNNNIALQKGMIISNEPGIYRTGEYGIRIENLVEVCQKKDKFLYFNTLTKAPYEERLIDFEMLNNNEKEWLKKNN